MINKRVSKQQSIHDIPPAELQMMKELSPLARIAMHHSKLKHLVRLENAIELRSTSNIAVPLGLEQVSGTLIRCGLHQSEVLVSGKSLMVPSVCVHQVQQ